MARSPLVLLVLLMIVSGAAAAVDAEINPNAKVKGSILPAGEVETFRFDAVAGTELTVKVAAKSGDLRNPTVVLSDPLDGLVNLDGFLSAGSGEVSVKKLVLALTGRYRLRVSGTGAGEYQLKLKGKPRESWSETVTIGGGVETVAFSAPAGSKVKFKAKTAKKSDAEPRLAGFEGEDLSTLGKIKTTSHKVTVEDVAGGDVTVGLRNLAAVSGEIVLKITVSAPDVEKDKLDFRGESLGQPDGGETVYSRTVEAGPGGTIEIDDVDSEIDGAKIVVPAGATDGDTRFLLSSGRPIEPEDDTWQMVGPTVEIGPAGVTLAQAVEVTVPYDPDLLSFGEVPLGVYRVEENGDASFIVALEVDTFARTVRFETRSFSRFRVHARRGAPRLQGRSYWNVFFEMALDASSAPNVPRRELYVGMGSVSAGSPGLPGSWAWTGVEHWFAWKHEDNTQAFHDDVFDGIQPTITGTTSSGLLSPSGSGTWSYQPGGQQIRVQLPPDDTIDYVMSEDGSILVAAGESDPTDTSTILEICLEKPSTRPTAAALAGKYTVAMIEIGAGMHPSTPVTIDILRSHGTMTVKGDGTYSMSLTDRGQVYDPAKAAWEVEKESFSFSGTFTVAGPADGVFDGTIVTTYDDEGETGHTRYFPSKDLNVLVGTDRDPCGCVLLVVAIRQGSGMKRSKITGDWFDVICEAYPRIETVRFYKENAEGQVIEERHVPFGDLTLVEETATFRFRGTSTFDAVSSAWRDIHRDMSQPTGVIVNIEHEAGPDTGSISVASSGKISISGGDWEPLLGAVDPGYRFMFLVVNPASSDSAIGLDFVLKPPPSGP